jgi:NADP-dependent 3-hydroxy acid dehydrogenase YdfG
VVDVNNRKQTKDSLLQFEEQFPIDVLVANAGVSLGSCASADDEEAAFFEVFETNTVGTKLTMNLISFSSVLLIVLYPSSPV